MAKFTARFRGVPDGEVYPKTYGPGDECPPELEPGAVAAGVLEQSSGDKNALDKKAADKAPENK
jgi:hypothetical protein